MKRLIAVFAVFLAITTAACSQSMNQPDIKLNPHPKMRYEITLTIEMRRDRSMPLRGPLVIR